MTMGYFQALRFLARVYRGYPLADRLHVFIRFVTCPFLRTTSALPSEGRFLEIGAGHGIFCYFAARAGSRVFAVEPDLRKSVRPAHAPGVRWIAGYDDCVGATFDTIAIYDATYRMSIAYRTELYRRVYDRLAPGGMFLFKDMNPERRLKMKWARLQEWLSDNLLKVSLGSGFVYQTPAEVEATLTRIGFVDIQARAIDRGYPHPHIVYTARKTS